MRGYGDSDKPSSIPGDDGAAAGGYDAANEALDIIGLLDHFGIEQTHIVGHDMGAPVALVFSGEHPERTLSVGYIDEPLIGFNETPMTAFSVENHGGFWQFGLNWAPGLAEILFAGHEAEFLRYIFAAMTYADGVLNEEDVEAHARGLLQENGIGGSVGWYRAVDETASQIRELAGRGAFRAPTLGVGGQYGVSVTGEQMNEVSDRVTAVVLKECGHLVPEEKPEELAKTMLEFFAAQVTPHSSL